MTNLARIVGLTPVTPPRSFMTGFMAGLGVASARRSALAVVTKSRNSIIVVDVSSTNFW